jgi:hypothetical protein
MAQAIARIVKTHNRRTQITIQGTATTITARGMAAWQGDRRQIGHTWIDQQ